MGFNSIIIGSSHTSYGGVDLICMNKGVNTQYLTLIAFDSLAGWRKSISSFYHTIGRYRIDKVDHPCYHTHVTVAWMN